jgi:hypothetical protein
MTNIQIEDIFSYHKPHGTQQQRYGEIRTYAKALALTIQECAPECREKSIAFTNLQQVVMWANAAIAINEKENT